MKNVDLCDENKKNYLTPEFLLSDLWEGDVMGASRTGDYLGDGDFDTGSDDIF